MRRVTRIIAGMWPATVRTRLICGVALVQFALMTALVADVVTRQREFLKRHSLEQTEGLTQTLAVTSTSWVLANDVVGLQEILDSVGKYPGLRYAMVVTPAGQVLAHTDRSRVGTFLDDDVSRSMLRGEKRARPLYIDRVLLDTAAPITTSAGQQIGWARVGQDQASIWKSVELATRNGVMYTILAIAIGSGFSILIGSWLTAGLSRLVAVSEQIRDGRRDLRMDIRGPDEISRVGNVMNQMLEAITSGEARLRAMFEQHHTVMMLVDPDTGSILDANAAAEKFYGYSAPTLRSMKVADINTRPESEVVGLRQEVLHGKRDSFITEHRTAGGGARIVEVYSSPIVAQGKTALLSIVTDITERVEAEKMRRLLSVIVESSDDAIVSKDLAGTILTWNQGAERMYGYSADEVIGKPLTLLVPEDRSDELSAIMSRIANGENVEHFETERVRKDGSRVAVSLAISPLREASGAIFAASVIARDITEHKRAEEARLVHLHFVESMDEINRAMQGTKSLEQMLSDTLDAVLSIFDCDRAWLVYPCDPDAPSWRVPMERTRALYPGAFGTVDEIPMSPEIHDLLNIVASASGVVKFGPDLDHPVPEELVQRFSVRSQAITMLRPKIGKPWVFGLHQCSYSRVWTAEDDKLIREIGRRLEDGLSSLLSRRDLQEREEILHAISTSAQDAIIMMDDSGKIVFWNPAAESVFGYSAEEALGQDLHTLLGPLRYQDDYGRGLTEFRISGRGPMVGKTIEMAAHRKGGAEFLIELSLSSVRRGNEWNAVGIVRDVTARKRAELALRESEEKYRLLVENADEAIFVIQNNVVEFPNRKTVALTGYAVNELSGMAFTNLIYSEDRSAIFEQCEKLLTGEKSYPVSPFRIFSKDGAIVWVQITAAPITWNNAPAALCFLKDITEQKTLEAQFIQAQKMEAVGQLAGGVAHDFNNMIGAILGHCELILGDTEQDDPVRMDVVRIRECAERSAALTRQLLAFSRRQALALQVFNLNEVLLGFRSVLERLIGEDIQLRMIAGTCLGCVKADRGQVEQIIMNLAINARDAMPSGGKLTIETANVYLDEKYASTHTDTTPGPHVMLAVSDTGHGMDQKTLQRVFEPFFTTKEAGKGTGLGLATVYGIVRQSGGSIYVYSEPGHGTTFKLYLPRVDEAPAPDPARVQPPMSGNGETVLVVEDEEALRDLVARVLRRRGYKVVTARNGNEAIEVINGGQDDIALLLTDVIMPEMGGHQLAELLSQTHPGMKVLYMSGYTDNTIMRDDILQDAANFLQKPFNKDSMLAKVRETLDRDPRSPEVGPVSGSNDPGGHDC